MTKTRLAVLFGGASSEHEVSLVSACAVLLNINRDEFDVVMIGITKSGKWYLFEGEPELIPDGKWEAEKGAPVALIPGGGSGFFVLSGDGSVKPLEIDAVFPVLHGKFGEDGTVQGMLELCGIPVVGCGCASSAVCMDKAFTKRTLAAEGIPQASAAIIGNDRFTKNSDECLDLAEKAADGYPIFVKPARAGSSVGVSKANDREALRAAFCTAFREDDKILAERCIVGREIEVAVLRKEDGSLVVSECGEIDPGSVFYDYETKYEKDTARYYIPARLKDDVSRRVRALAEKIFTLLDCRGFARVDFFVSDDGAVTFNEINTIPGFTQISMYPKLMEHSGISFAELVSLLVREAISRASHK